MEQSKIIDTLETYHVSWREGGCDEEDQYNVFFAKMHKSINSLIGRKLIMFHCLVDMVGKIISATKELKALATKQKENSDILKRKVDFEEARNDKLCMTIQKDNEG